MVLCIALYLLLSVAATWVSASMFLCMHVCVSIAFCTNARADTDV